MSDRSECRDFCKDAVHITFQHWSRGLTSKRRFTDTCLSEKCYPPSLKRMLSTVRENKVDSTGGRTSFFSLHTIIDDDRIEALAAENVSDNKCQTMT